MLPPTTKSPDKLIEPPVYDGAFTKVVAVNVPVVWFVFITLVAFTVPFTSNR